MKSVTKAALVLLLAAGVAAIQYHSWFFWSTYVTPEAPYVGWGLSLLLEAVALFFWATRKWTSAAVATVLLLAGPMAHLGMPVYSDIQASYSKGAVSNQMLSTIDERIAETQERLNTMEQRMAEGHSGLAMHIESHSQSPTGARRCTS